MTKPGAGPTGRFRILQIHPTRRCNLRCLHCYSSSGPEVAERLPREVALDLLDGARAEGYTVAGFSGGEPLLYPGLRDALARARSLGFTTTVTSNGMLLDERRLAVLDGVTDVLAISLDGVPEAHDRLRANPRAFDTMRSRLDGVRRSGLAFGFIFTLTQHNLDQLPWVASFALEEGAQLLQIHPLELAGRAAEELPGQEPDGLEAKWAYVAAAQLQRAVGDRLRVQLDLADREVLRGLPERAFAATPEEDADGRPLAEELSPLIVEPDGTVVPVQYGFPRRYALGRLGSDSFADCARRWRGGVGSRFRSLCRRTFDQLMAGHETAILNWYDRIAARATAEEPAEQRLVAIG